MHALCDGFGPRPAINPSQHSNVAQCMASLQASSLRMCLNYRQAKKKREASVHRWGEAQIERDRDILVR